MMQSCTPRPLSLDIWAKRHNDRFGSNLSIRFDSIYEIGFYLSRPAKPTPPPPSDKQMKSLFGPSARRTNPASSNTNPLRRWITTTTAFVRPPSGRENASSPPVTSETRTSRGSIVVNPVLLIKIAELERLVVDSQILLHGWRLYSQILLLIDPQNTELNIGHATTHRLYR